VGGKPRVSPTPSTTEKAGPPNESKVPLRTGFVFSSDCYAAWELLEWWINRSVELERGLGASAVQSFLPMVDG
jgi:hypothetical protein